MDPLAPSLPNAGLPPPAPAGMAGLAILLAELSQTLAELPAGTQIPALVTQILPQASPQPQSQTQPQPQQSLQFPDAAAAPKGANAGPLLILSTPDGPAQVRIPANLQIPPGAKLEIAVATAGPQPQWRLTAIDGKPVGPGPAPVPVPAPVSLFNARPLSPAASPTPSVAAVETAPRPVPAQGILATLVKSADPAVVPSGTTLLVRITALIPPIQTAAAQSEPQPPAIAAPEEEPEASPAPASVATSVQTAPAPMAAPSATATPASAPVPIIPRTAPVPVPSLGSAPAPAPTTAATAPSPTIDSQPTAQIASPPAAAPAPAQSPVLVAAPAPTAVPVPTGAATATPAPTMAPLPAPTVAPVPTGAGAATPAPIVAPAPAPIATPNPTAAPPPAEIAGDVLPNTDAGRTLVKTPLGLLALAVDPQSAPPAGAHIAMTVIGKPVPPAIPILAPPPDEPADKALPRRLSDLVQQVQSSGDGKLAEAVRQALPAPGPKLAAQLLAVIASADPSQGLPRLLGDGLINALSHAAPDAMAQLSRQWETISHPVQGPDDGDWRSLLLPLMMGGQIIPLRLTTRQRRRGGGSPADREKGTRFLLDFDLSRLGPMQFDGLVKRQHKQFDLIIRSKEPLSGEMRRDIDGLFLNGLMNFGLRGSIGFQPDGRFVATAPLTGAANGIIFA